MALAESGFCTKLPSSTPRQRRSLFISYDGLLDPLGASQILPYLRAISVQEDLTYVLSFEKPERYSQSGQSLREELSKTQIRWSPLLFTSSWGLAGKLWDFLCMVFVACRIAARGRPSVVHSRGHVPAPVALLVKLLFGSKFLFDFRGLWVDERVDKGGWKLSNSWHFIQYKVCKRIEGFLLAYSDHVVVLTQAVVPEVLRLGVPAQNRITCIPCCADFSHFHLASRSTRRQARIELGLPETSLVLGYLGSVGGMYLTDRFLRLLELAIAKYQTVQALVLTIDRDKFYHLLHNKLPACLHDRVHLRVANRDQVARWLPAMDLLVAFAKPSYARISMSPTKLAEVWATGIPVICNHGVGDVTTLVAELDAGIVIDANDDKELCTVSDALADLLVKGGQRLRDAAIDRVSLDLAARSYCNVYNLLRN